MSGYSVASTATSTPAAQRAPAATRRVLWTNGTVRVAIPKDAKKTTRSGQDAGVSGLVFGRSIRGNAVNCYVLPGRAAEDLRGKRITAAVTVMEKALVNGEVYLYVNLVPVAAGTPPTHRLTILPGRLSDFALESGWVAFETPAAKSPNIVREGVIVLSPPDAKVRPKNR